VKSFNDPFHISGIPLQSNFPFNTFSEVCWPPLSFFQHQLDSLFTAARSLSQRLLTISFPQLLFKMKYSSSVLAAGAGLITTVSAHGFITSPQARLAGPAMEAACGTQVYNNQASDNYGNIQGELQIAATQTDYNAAECNIWLCKGFKYADNTANVQNWTAGQVVNFTFDVRAPHTGYANVSIVNTATNTIVGDQLLYYSDFADNAKTIPTNETSFSITIPSDLGDTCSTAGACVVQHYWNAASIDQTYESCVDFVVGGSASGSPSASANVSSVVTTSSAVAVSTAFAVGTSVVSSFGAILTTFQTVVSSSLISSTSTEAAAAASNIPDDDEDTC
jgi:predicted carbohydrate-binding protein with CBM5 and CBM33 domain